MPWIILVTDRTEAGAPIWAVARKFGPEYEAIFCDTVSEAERFDAEADAKFYAAKLQAENPSLLLTPFQL